MLETRTLDKHSNFLINVANVFEFNNNHTRTWFVDKVLFIDTEQATKLLKVYSQTFSKYCSKLTVAIHCSYKIITFTRSYLGFECNFYFFVNALF